MQVGLTNKHQLIAKPVCGSGRTKKHELQFKMLPEEEYCLNLNRKLKTVT